MAHQDTNELSIVSNMLPQIEEHLEKVTKLHKKVSDLKTPESQVKKRGFDGQEYVELSYMKFVGRI